MRLLYRDYLLRLAETSFGLIPTSSTHMFKINPPSFQTAAGAPPSEHMAHPIPAFLFICLSFLHFPMFQSDQPQSHVNIAPLLVSHLWLDHQSFVCTSQQVDVTHITPNHSQDPSSLSFSICRQDLLTMSTTFPLKNFHSSAFLLSLHIMWTRDSAILHLGSHKEMSLFCYISSSPPSNPLSSPWHSFQRAAWSPFVLYPSIFSYYFDIIPQVLQIHRTWPVGAH